MARFPTDRQWDKNVGETLAADNISFNILKHKLVPEHRLLTDDEASEILQKLGVTKDQLPKIRKNDAAIRVLERTVGEPIVPGSVIEVVRESETAEEFVAYRVVVTGGEI